jgi:hypothetical protein
MARLIKRFREGKLGQWFKCADCKKNGKHDEIRWFDNLDSYKIPICTGCMKERDVVGSPEIVKIVTDCLGHKDVQHLLIDIFAQAIIRSEELAQDRISEITTYPAKEHLLPDGRPRFTQIPPDTVLPGDFEMPDGVIPGPGYIPFSED